MLELRFIRENLDLVIEKMRFRGMSTNGIDKFAEIDQQRRSSLSEVEGLRNKRKTASQEIAKLKKNGENADSQVEEMRRVGDLIKELEGELQKIEGELQEIVMEIPNLASDSIPLPLGARCPSVDVSLAQP